jgi:hypothetical protein
MVPILGSPCSPRIECLVSVPAEVYGFLQAHQTVKQCDREVRGQVRGVVDA